MNLFFKVIWSNDGGATPYKIKGGIYDSLISFEKDKKLMSNFDEFMLMK